MVNAGLGTRGEKKGYLQDAAEGASELRDLVSGVAENELKAPKISVKWHQSTSRETHNTSE